MPRTCTVCSHLEREAIDKALIADEPSRQIAARYGSLSRAAIQRHAEKHLPETLRSARAAEEVGHADRLARELEEVKADVRRLRGAAESEGDYRTALTGCDKALKALELQGKLAQLIDEGTTVNVLLSPQWIEIRGVLLDALASYPQARSAVAASLLELEGNGNGR